MAVNGGQATIVKVTPQQSADIDAYFEQLSIEGKGHISGIETVASDGSLRVRLSTPTTSGGDMRFLVKKGRLAEAKSIVENIVSRLEQGFPASESDTRRLYDNLDNLPR